MKNLNQFEFIRQGNIFFKDYHLAREPISQTSNDSLGQIYRMFPKSGVNDQDDQFSSS